MQYLKINFLYITVEQDGNNNILRTYGILWQMRETNTQTLFQVSLLWRYFTSKELNNLSCFKTTRLDSDINGFGRSCIMASHLRVIQFFDYSRLVLAIGTRLIVIIKPSHLCPASCDSMSSVLQKRRSGICSDAWIPLFMYIIS